MLNTNAIEKLVQAYIVKNFKEPISVPILMPAIGPPIRIVLKDPDEIDFNQLLEQAKIGKETFSEMLLRLIKESNEKNPTIYNRANIDRRHFSKIANNPDYKPSKQTVLAFAIALKLDFEQTRNLLAVAGFTLSKTRECW